MSAPDTRDVIADTLAEDEGRPTVHRHYNGAEAVLDALTDAGFAVVKLPEQMDDRSAVLDSIKDWPMWQLGDSWAAVDEEGDIELETDGQTANVSGMSVTDAMNLVRVVLAAAAHAEAGEDRG